MPEINEINLINGAPDPATPAGTVPTLAPIRDRLGAIDETPPGNDTAASGLNGRLQRVLQKLTAGLVGALGARTVAQSPAVNLATDDPQIGTKVTAIAALATGGTGIIGWLSQIWQALGSATPAGEAHIGSITGNTSYVDVVLVVDTTAYASGELLVETQLVANAMRINDATGYLQSVVLLDEDDLGQPIDLIFMSANNSFGTRNAAPTITDAHARDILGVVRVIADDYVDIGGARLATKTGVGLVVKPAAGTRSLYIAAIIRAAATYAGANALRLRLGFLQD